VLFQTITGVPAERPSGTSSVHPSHPPLAFSSRTLQGEVTMLLRDRLIPINPPKAPGSISSTPSLDFGDGTPTRGSNASKTAIPLDRTDSSVTIPECVRNAIGRSEPPIAAERGVFKGTEAYLVVLPHATDRGKVSAYVVDAACTQKPLGSAGTVLLSRSYPRR
jgi:hypothetical protein